MSSKLEAILPKFKNAQLSRLASLCGVKVTGRKAEFVERLVAAAEARAAVPPAVADKPLILSIDMGIRNLGYSLISPAPSPSPSPSKRRSSAAKSAAAKTTAITAEALREPPRIHLHAWQRRELLESAVESPDDNERFSPASMAVVTDQLVRRDLLPLKPTHILIERQRWRSGGGMAVSEWTLRVNTLEAMLHASLRTLRELGHWDGELLSVLPDRVMRFWQPASPVLAAKDEEAGAAGGKAKKATKASQSSKKHKIAVLKGWLTREGAEEVIVPANPNIEDAVKQFRMKLAGARRPRGGKESPHGVLPQKLDDLTDSLLQGVAWLKWEENKASLLTEDGLTKLLEEKLLDELEANTILDDV